MISLNPARFKKGDVALFLQRDAKPVEDSPVAPAKALFLLHMRKGTQQRGRRGHVTLAERIQQPDAALPEDLLIALDMLADQVDALTARMCPSSIGTL